MCQEGLPWCQEGLVWSGLVSPRPVWSDLDSLSVSTTTTATTTNNQANIEPSRFWLNLKFGNYKDTCITHDTLDFLNSPDCSSLLTCLESPARPLPPARL